MAEDYADRVLDVVRVHGLTRGRRHDGVSRVGAQVELGLSAPEDSLFGPAATVHVAVTGERSRPIEELEDRLLAAAHAVIRHLASATLEDWLETRERWERTHLRVEIAED